MASDDLTALRRLLTEGLGARRFTQASPVLPDVWLAYAAAPEEPRELLLTPDRRGRAGVLARDLRAAIAEWRRTSGARKRPSPRIASVPDLVAVRLYLDELVAVVLPWTHWWADIVERPMPQSEDAAARGVRGRLGEEDRARIADLIEEARESSRFAGGLVRREEEWKHDFVWLVALVGWILRGASVPEPPARELVDHFAGVFPEGLPEASRTGHDNPWRVSLNRSVGPAALPSVLAVKADAAVRLFDISCRNVTWAILDGGIDRHHPAFIDWDQPQPSIRREPQPTAGEDRPQPRAVKRPNRIDRTYDFTDVRDLLDPAAMSALAKGKDASLTEEERRFKRRLELNLEELGFDDPTVAAGRYARDSTRRLADGLEIDWALLEPFLRDLDPPDPATGHGTHVAGVLGADWHEDAVDADGNVTQGPLVMEGVCPDIRLFDMRVLKAGHTVNEFEVIAALQFIAFLNRRADTQVVQGANLSIETPHNVDNYACGSTPVCEQCNRVWASGVVLVAAAGNRGHQHYQLASGEPLGGYHAISITDPGNADGVITVGSTHARAHRYGVSYFSSRGPTGDGRRKPDLVAPGEQIRGPAPHGGESCANGTSFAAPHVSGAAALLMARFEELRGQPERIKAILCGNATDLGREPYFQGAGMVDVLRALQSIGGRRRGAKHRRSKHGEDRKPIEDAGRKRQGAAGEPDALRHHARQCRRQGDTSRHRRRQVRRADRDGHGPPQRHRGRRAPAHPRHRAQPVPDDLRVADPGAVGRVRRHRMVRRPAHPGHRRSLRVRQPADGRLGRIDRDHPRP